MADKIYVEIIARYTTDGRILPMTIIWEDGRKFDIDKISDIRRAASLKAGGAGIRYVCRVGGEEKNLFLEETKWFIEGK